MLDNTVALLLAAGLGTRLKPLTNIWPKCLMPIHTKPLMDYWLEKIYDLKLSNTIVNTHSHKDIMADYLNRPRYKSWVNNSYEPKLLGTAGTLRKNYNFLKSKTVLLIHADNWSNCNLKEFLDFHQNRENKNYPISMMSFKTQTPHTCGILELESKSNIVVNMHEKSNNYFGNIANAAIYAIEAEVIEYVLKNDFINDFSTQVIPKFLGKIYSWENLSIHRDIGNLENLILSNQDPKPELLWKKDDIWQKDFINSETFSILHRYIDKENAK